MGTMGWVKASKYNQNRDIKKEVVTGLSIVGLWMENGRRLSISWINGNNLNHQYNVEENINYVETERITMKFLIRSNGSNLSKEVFIDDLNVLSRLMNERTNACMH